MGVLDWLIGSRPLAAETVPHAFEVIDRTSIDPAFFGFASYTDPLTPVSRVTVAQARQVPAVKRARDIICGTLGGIPMQMVGPDFRVAQSPLLDQPEANVPRSVTITRLFEDLLFEGVAWWKVTQRDYRGYPVSVVRLDPCLVSVSDGRVYVDGRPVQYDQLIQFSSPNGPLLVDGARAIRTLIRLEASAAVQSEDPVMSGYFSPTDDADPFDDDTEAQAFLAAWGAARQKRSTAYIPAGLEYHTTSYSPKDLQLIEARQHAVLEVARLTGIDSEDLSVSTTSRTYFNAQDRRLERIADVLGPYSLAVTDRLRMTDITPRGYEVRADFSGFLRADDKTRLENYTAAKALGLLTLDDIAQREGLPTPEAPPLVSVTQVPADTTKEIVQ